MMRVAIVAESSVVRAGLAALFGAEPDIAVVAWTAAELESRDRSSSVELESHNADVVVWALPPQGVVSHPHTEDEDLDAGPSTRRVLALLDGAGAEAVARALRSGARAVLPVDADADELIAAVRAVAAGLTVISPAMATEFLDGALVSGGSSAMPLAATERAALTAREREVLALLAEGLANKMIAPRLGITEHTVKTHIAAVYEKLHARNRAEAVVAAARQGLLLL